MRTKFRFRSLRRATALILLCAGIGTTSTLISAHGDHANPNHAHTQTAADTPASAEAIQLVASSPEAEELSARAIKATASGDLETAEKLYRELYTEHPDLGAPALARFYRLTAQKQEAAQFRDELSAASSSIGVATHARALVELGDRETAISLLQATLAENPADNPAGVLVLASLYRQTGNSDARAELLVNAMQGADSPPIARHFAYELIPHSLEVIKDQPHDFVSMIEIVLASPAMDHDKASQLFDPVIFRIQQDEEYFRLRDTLLDEGNHHAAATAWFAARLLIREENMDRASAYLKSRVNEHKGSTLWPVLAEEYARVLKAEGRHDEVAFLYANIGDTGDPTLKLEAAEYDVFQKDFENADKLLSSMDFAALEPQEQVRYWIARLNATAGLGKTEETIDLFRDAIESLGTGRYSLLITTIFKQMSETDQHIAIEEQIRARFRSNPNTMPELWLLAAGAARESRRKPNEIEALYQYATCRPESVTALDILAMEVVPLARELSNAPPEIIAAPDGEVERMVDLMEKSLRQLIQARPYDPTAYAELIQYYKEKHENGKAIAVAVDVANDSDNPRIVSTAAYVLAINGFPREALSLYDKAIRLSPDGLNVRMNRASCLTRLGRWEEARTFYREMLENGYKNRPVHVHEQIQRLWRIATQLEQETECLAYFENAIERIDSQWRTIATLDMAHLLAEEDRPEDAERFYHRAMELAESQELRVDAWESLATVWYKRKDYQRALETLTEAQGKFPEGSADWLNFYLMEAQVRVESGERGQAVAMLTQASTLAPDHQHAYGGLFRAAQLMGEDGEIDRAKELYEQFLASPSRDFPMRREAEKALSGLEPTKSLTQAGK